ncbi:MAG: L-serine ammonia-lyase, iron-sulfur-dependent, subunit alpha [Clostridia bacterium]|nr:L-serine ammonia-lyase, iron-sulfur-dependent, subunit alpha [Clostridia bacterium]
MNYDFISGDELLLLTETQGLSIAEIMLRRETARSDLSREEIIAEMRRNLDTMRSSVHKGLTERQKSVSGLSGGDAELLLKYSKTPDAFSGEKVLKAVASSMAVVEVNASMGRIVAAPTAGASGILPGALLECGKERGWDDDTLIMGLFAASAVGMLIARNASISGAAGGCQAETGAAASMAAAALVECAGGSPLKALHAAAIALKNVLGLVCDPVAGLVECPCIKRNAIGAANAMLSADLALAGIESMIPFDEVVSSMKRVGSSMAADLRETARGGLATTPTGKALKKRLKLDI